jgi:hypothetical protein
MATGHLEVSTRSGSNATFMLWVWHNGGVKRMVWMIAPLRFELEAKRSEEGRWALLKLDVMDGVLWSDHVAYQTT